MSIIRKVDGSLEFSVFRKPTHTDKYLNYDSYHPREQKLAVVNTLFSRANSICDPAYLPQENKHVSHVLQNNGYPKSIVNQISAKSHNKFNNNRNQHSQNNEDSPSYVSLPYIKGPQNMWVVFSRGIT